MEYVLRAIAELLFIRTARLVLGVFGFEAPEMVELLLGLFLWLIGGAILIAVLR